ncbi:MAG: TonB family protein [Bacteroidota bacterium]
MSRTYTDAPEIKFTIPWDKLVFRGFVLSLIIHGLLLLLLPMFTIEVRPFRDEVRTIPVELINFGLGDGTGKSAGNLTEKGRSAKGHEVKDPLADAAIATKTKVSKTTVSTDPTQSNTLIAVKEIPTDAQTNQPTPATGSSSIGKKDGDPTGSGLSDAGLGKGRGLGLGDIDWGGGGNRTVLNKVLPQFPPGAQPSRVRLKFLVAPDGRVTKVYVVLKGDPKVERAAIDAMWKWKFSPLASNTEMVGEIPFNFQLR